MSSPPENHCPHLDQALLHSVQALPPDEAAAFEEHLAGCAECRAELDSVRPAVESFVDWPTDVLRPAEPLWSRLAERIGHESDVAPSAPWVEPPWKKVAPGISCKLLATDPDRRFVSMLVRLEPRTDYPPHRHAGIEELHLLDGVLIVDDRTLYPGDYIRSEIGTADARVYSETGCTCVLMTSIDDALG